MATFCLVIVSYAALFGGGGRQRTYEWAKCIPLISNMVRLGWERAGVHAGTRLTLLMRVHWATDRVAVLWWFSVVVHGRFDHASDITRHTMYTTNKIQQSVQLPDGSRAL